jgi:hypothetical protein
MAIENKYVDAQTVAGRKTDAAYTGSGSNEIVMVATFEIAAADDDGSVYRVFKDVPSTYIPTDITVVCDAITGGTSFDLGLYKTNLGAVINKNLLMSAQTLATALTRATGHQLGLANVNIANCKDTLGTLSAQTTIDPAYDLAVTGNTVGTAAGTVSVIARFVQI